MLAKTKNYRPSDKEPFMNERQREYFRAKLLAWREDILKEAKETLPMLRSVAVRTLSDLPMASARVMTIDQFAAALNKAFDHEFEEQGREKPFDEVMIGKLIVE